MNAHIKRSYREKLGEIFYRIKTHPWHERLMSMPFWIRFIVALLLCIAGIVGIFTPIPAGWIMILSAGVLVFGLHMVRRQTIKMFFFFRLHKMFEYIRYKMKK